MTVMLLEVATWLVQVSANDTLTYGQVSLIVMGVIVVPLFLVAIIGLFRLWLICMQVYNAIFDPKDGIKESVRLLRERSHNHGNTLQELLTDMENVKTTLNTLMER